MCSVDHLNRPFVSAIDLVFSCLSYNGSSLPLEVSCVENW